jgi:ATP-binding cassette subfamily F protein uup
MESNAVPRLTLEKASLAYGHVALFDRVGFQLDAKERVGLIGHNGGGKPTLLRVLARSAALNDK